MDTSKKSKKSKPSWVNGLGEQVPDSAVQPFDKRKEKVLERLLKKAIAVSEALEKVKTEMLTDGDALYDERMVLKGFKKDERKGNYTLFSYSKHIKLELSVREMTSFNDDIYLAQRKLNDYIDLITDGSNQDLKLLVNNAFKTTKGRLDKNRVLNLLSLPISHPTWNEAMELIRSSITVGQTKRYPAISMRNSEGEYEQINLNFTTI